MVYLGFMLALVKTPDNVYSEYFLYEGRKIKADYAAASMGLWLERIYEEYKKGNFATALQLSYDTLVEIGKVTKKATYWAKRYGMMTRNMALLMFVSLLLKNKEMPSDKEFVDLLFKYFEEKYNQGEDYDDQIVAFYKFYLHKDYNSAFELTEKFFNDVFRGDKILSWYRAKFYKRFYLYWLSELALKAGYEDKFRYYFIEYLRLCGLNGLIWVVNPKSHPLLESPFVALGEYGGLKNAGKILGAIWRSDFGFLRKLEFTVAYLIMGLWYSLGMWLILMSLLVVGLVVGIVLLRRRKRGTGTVSEEFSGDVRVR